MIMIHNFLIVPASLLAPFNFIFLYPCRHWIYFLPEGGLILCTILPTLFTPPLRTHTVLNIILHRRQIKPTSFTFIMLG